MVAAVLGSIDDVSDFRQEKAGGWAIPSSLLFHALLVGTVIALPPKRWARPPPQEGILIEILSSGQYRAIFDAPAELPAEDQAESVAPAASPDRFATQPAALPPKPDPVEQSTMIRPSGMLSAAVLADPRSRQARTALRQLSAFDRREQLCNLEAMEQIHAWRATFEPERLVAYAMADTSIAGNTVLAEGAAFRSARQWYNLKYRCEVTPDLTQVTAFEFLVGDPIPREDWEAHYLPERY